MDLQSKLNLTVNLYAPHNRYVNQIYALLYFVFAYSIASLL